VALPVKNKTYTNNREYRRINVEIPVKISLPGKSDINGIIRNISEGGAFIEVSNTNAKPGEKISIDIDFKGTKVLVGTVAHEGEFEILVPANERQIGSVRWNSSGEFNGVGVQFEGLEESKRAFIRSVIKYYDSLTNAGVTF